MSELNYKWKQEAKKIKNIKGLNNMSTIFKNFIMPLVHNLHQKKFFFPSFPGLLHQCVHKIDGVIDTLLSGKQWQSCASFN